MKYLFILLLFTACATINYEHFVEGCMDGVLTIDDNCSDPNTYWDCYNEKYSECKILKEMRYK